MLYVLAPSGSGPLHFPFPILTVPSPPCRSRWAPARDPMPCGSAFPVTTAVDQSLPKSLSAVVSPLFWIAQIWEAWAPQCFLTAGARLQRVEPGGAGRAPDRLLPFPGCSTIAQIYGFGLLKPCKSFVVSCCLQSLACLGFGALFVALVSAGLAQSNTKMR